MLQENPDNILGKMAVKLWNRIYLSMKASLCAPFSCGLCLGLKTKVKFFHAALLLHQTEFLANS